MIVDVDVPSGLALWNGTLTSLFYLFAFWIRIRIRVVVDIRIPESDRSIERSPRMLTNDAEMDTKLTREPPRNVTNLSLLIHETSKASN